MREISFREWLALFWLSLLAPATELLPGPRGPAGIVGILLGGAVLALGGQRLQALCRGGHGLAGGLRERFGGPL